MVDVATGAAFIRDFGLPLAALVIILWAGAKKLWVWGYRLKEEQDHYQALLDERDKAFDKMVAEKDARFAAMLQEKDSRFIAMTNEKDARFNAMITEKDARFELAQTFLREQLAESAAGEAEWKKRYFGLVPILDRTVGVTEAIADTVVEAVKRPS